MKKGGDKSMILRKFGVKVLRERNAYWEAVNVMGETYCKIAFMNLRSGSCRYIKTDPQELELEIELLSRCWSSSLPKSSRLSRSYRAVIFSFFLITCAPFFGFRLCVLRDFPTA